MFILFGIGIFILARRPKGALLVEGGVVARSATIPPSTSNDFRILNCRLKGI